MGEVIYRAPVKPPKPPPPPPHQCWKEQPNFRYHDFNFGDIWLCDCGRKYRVSKDSENDKLWRRHLRPLWFKKRHEGWQKEES